MANRKVKKQISEVNRGQQRSNNINQLIKT